MLTVGSAQRMDTLLSYIQRTQTAMEKAEYQVATGNKGPKFADYDRMSSVVTVNAKISHRETFMTNAETASLTLTLANNVLNDIGDIAQEAGQFTANNTYRIAEAADLRNSAEGWLATIISSLNLQGTDGYMFGGLDGNGPPVGYATDLTDPSWTALAGDPDDIITPFDPTAEGYFWFLNQDVIGTAAADLPIDYDGTWPTSLSPSTPYEDQYYQGGRLTDANGNIDEGLRTRIDRDQTVATGFSAAEDGLEKLMFALHMVMLTPIPNENPGPGEPSFDEQSAFYSKNIKAAHDLITEAIPDITRTHLRAASTEITVQHTLTRHEQTLALEKNTLGDLTKVDRAEAITTFQLLERNLNATYEVTSRVSELSLANYI